MAEDPAARIRDGRAWSDFCRALERAGRVVVREGSPDDAFDRAEGFRYLSRLLRGALETFLETGDPAFPIFRRPAHETLKLGADNPDNLYLAATISGEHEYRIHGLRGTVHYLGIGSYVGHYGKDGARGQSGYLERFETAPDGRFEVVVSREPRPGNWLPLSPESDLLIVRQSFLDRGSERPAELAIERVGAARAPEPVTPAFVDEGLAAAAAWVAGTAGLFADWAEEFARRRNELPRFDPARAAAAHGDPNIAYYHGYWELADDEAWLVELVPPPCEYWNFQVGNHWMESLDYRWHRIALNHHQAVAEADGSVRLVVAHRDPGLPNWLETAGHRRGTACLRFVGARREPAAPRVRVVRRAELPRAAR